MANFKYAVKNGDNVLGIMWETDRRDVFVVMSDWDINHSIEIRDQEGNVIDDRDSIDLLMNILPR